MTPESIQTLFEYHYWASDRVWACIDALTDEQFVYPLDYSMGSIRHHIVHLMSGTRRWIQRIQHVAITPHLEFDDFPTKALARQQWDSLRDETLRSIHTLDQVHLNAAIRWTIPTRNIEQSTPVWALLLHVVNHATDHRAQILTLLHHHFGVETVEQDMIFYLAEQKII
jgi:uncharacterized damage-inducible protein DinB